MSEKVRVRFAPSPTGPLHIGGVRTALYNYLYAKKNGGAFILRIEDTDQNRYVEGAETYIMEALKWCGLPYDEGPDVGGKYGPYRQSERKNLYANFAQELISKGKAYYAFDSTQELDFHRKEHEGKGKTFIYNWHNRLKLTNSLSLSTAETQARIAAGNAYVIRFKSPEGRNVVLNDLIRGTIEIDSNLLDDKVLFKSDGMPTYHLANIVDDHLMKISHVIRGEEWLPSLALHTLLYEAFGWNAPKFAHLPLIMKPVGKGKLSKRDGEKMGFPVFPLSWESARGYRESGYFPEAVVNFLALLGWNPGTEQELFSLEELVNAFELERVQRSGARFDPEKTKWYNHHYLQQKSIEELSRLFAPIIEKELKINNDQANSKQQVPSMAYIETVVGLIKERATFVADLWSLGNYFFTAPKAYDQQAVKKHWKEETPGIMQSLRIELQTTKDFSPTTLETLVKAWIQNEKLSFGKVMAPLRLILVGGLQGPQLFDIMALLGQEETIRRIDMALQNIRIVN